MYLKTAVVLAVFTIAANAAELSLGHVNPIPGQAADLNVKIASGATAPTGVPFELEYNSAAIEVRVEAGPVVRAAEKTLHVNLEGEASVGRNFPSRNFPIGLGSIKVETRRNGQ